MMQESILPKRVTLTAQQQEALSKIELFLNGNVPVFILKGYAGTGKTTLLTYILKMLGDQKRPCQLMAPTGRAAKVIRDKTGCEATTIHKAIYAFDRLEEKNAGKNDGIRFIFPLRTNEGSHPVCIVDEASMVSSMKSTHEIYQFGTDILLNDLLTYSAPNSGGKIIFIGDPAQLPPVSDSRSLALEESYFQSLGLETMNYELTEVLRQADNAISRNALAIREMLRTNQFANFTFETKTNEVEPMSDLVENFCAQYDLESSSNPIVITYSNQRAQKYNREIRAKLFPGKMRVAEGDILMCVSNNYSFEEPIFNGDFVRVLHVSEQMEKHNALTSVEAKGKMKPVSVTLTFRQIVIQLSSGVVVDCRVMEDLLNNGEPSLSVAETNALFLDFKLRNPKLKPGTEEFRMALQRDPYFNALRAKYGYAITGHKSQGGEWDTVFVDYSGRTFANAQTLRWIYTVTTRAKKSLFAPFFPSFSNFKQFRMESVTKVAARPADFVTLSQSSEVAAPTSTPYHSASAPDFLKAKFAAIESALAGSDFSIVGVQSCNYLEKYTIATPSGRFVFNGYYKKNQQFSFSAASGCPESAEVVAILNNPVAKAEKNTKKLEYAPANDNLKDLYEDISPICEELDVELTNVVEHLSAYYVRYCFEMGNSFAYIDFFFDKNGFLTYGRPSSSLGEADSILKKIIKEFLE